MRASNRLRNRLLQGALVLVCLLGVVPAVRAESETVEKLASILDKVPGGVGGVNGNTVRSVGNFFTCLDSGTDALVCLDEAKQDPNSPLQQVEGIPSWFWMLVDAYIAVRQSDFWGVVAALGEAVVCIVAQVLTGGTVDVCALIEALIAVGEAVYDAVVAVLEWIADLGDAIWGAIRGAACEIYSWFGGDCDDEDAPPPADAVAYGVFFAPRLADGTGLNRIEQTYGSAFPDHVSALKQQAQPNFPGNPGAVSTAASWYTDNVHDQWTADILKNVMSGLIQARSGRMAQEVVRAETDVVWNAASAGSWPNDFSLMEEVFSQMRTRCGRYLDGELGYGHVSRWVGDPRHRAQAADSQIVSNSGWCRDMWLEPNKPLVTARVREHVETGVCPESPNGQVLVCPNQESLRLCQLTMSYFSEQGRCQNLGAELEQKCPLDAQGRHMCTTRDNYAYCQQNLSQSGQSGQCYFGPKVMLEEHCPDLGQLRLVCTSAAYYKFCKDNISEVNAFTGNTQNCGWSREAANELLQGVKLHFEQEGSRYPCTTTPVTSNHQAVKYSCSRPVQREVCRGRGEPEMLNCDGTNSSAYTALAAHVASEVAGINSRMGLTTAQTAAQRKLEVGSPDVLGVSVQDPSYCATLSEDATIPGTPFAVPPSGQPKFEFDCDAHPGANPSGPGESVDGLSTPRIRIPFELVGDLTGKAKKKLGVNTDIRAVGQKKVGHTPIDERINVENRVRDGDMKGIDVQHAEVQHVGAAAAGVAQTAKVAGKLAAGQTATGKLSPGQTALNAARPEEEEQGRRDLVTGAALAGTGAAAPVAHMAPVMGNAPAGAAAAGAPPPVSAAPSAPTVKPDITAASQVTIANRPADWNAPVMLDARDALRAANGVCLFTLRYTARNIGVAPAGAFSSTLASSAVPGPSERLWPGLAPAAASAQSDVVSLKPGLNTLTLWLDQKNEIQESNEANNQSRLQVNLTGTCDATARAVRPGTAVAAVPVNPVTGLPAVRPPTSPTPLPAGGAQVSRTGTVPKVLATPTPVSPIIRPGDMTLPKAGATPTPAGVTTHIDTPGTLTPMQGGADLVPVGSLTIAGRKADWNGAVSLDTKEAQHAEGGVCSFSVQYAARNAGNAASGAFDSALSISTGGTSAIASWPALAAGAQGGRTDSVDLKPGLNLLTLVLDRSGQVKESNEANNQVGLSVSVSGTCAAPIPLSVPGAGVNPPAMGATPTPAAPTVPLGPKALATPAPAKK
jgi:hypothetical protein